MPRASPHLPSMHRSKRRKLIRWSLHATGVLLVCGALVWQAFPFRADRLDAVPAGWNVTDRHGHVLRRTLDEEDRRADPVALDDVSPWVRLALTAAEDRRFASHPGVDPAAIARAAAVDLRHGRIVSGASTLSTQVIRLAEPRPRTFRTKAIEAFRALQMERRLDKPRILQAWLNRAPFGGNIVGIREAARAYFGKEPRDLTLGEASLLAGLPQSPARFRPDRALDRALQRRAYVLGRMETEGWITSAQRADAERQVLDVRALPLPFTAPHACDLALRQASLATAPRDASGRRHLRTTLDARTQALVESLLAGHADRLAAAGIHGAAIVVADVATSDIRALVGSPDFTDARHAGQVNAATARRSPGSALKPSAYAAAFDRGFGVPDTVVTDLPTAFRDYRPENFDAQFRGLVSVREALVDSLNIPALALTARLGVPRLLEQLRACGFTTLDRPAEHYGASLVLGTAEVTPLDLCAATACLARGGVYRALRLLDAEPHAPGSRVFSEAACFLVADVLSGPERALALTGHRLDTPLPRFALKTGTSSGFRDAWATAWTPDLVVTVWLGAPSGASVPGLTGLAAAAPLAADLLRALLPAGESRWYEPPPGLTRRPLCAATGRRPNAHCPQTAEGWWMTGVTAPDPCEVHRLVRATPDAPSAVIAVWPDAVTRFLEAAAGGPTGIRAPTHAPRLLVPAPDARYRIEPGRPRETQSLHLRAEAPSDAGSLYWFLDGRFLAELPPQTPLPWRLEPGNHTVRCALADGRHAETTFHVQADED